MSHFSFHADLQRSAYEDMFFVSHVIGSQHRSITSVTQ